MMIACFVGADKRPQQKTHGREKPAVRVTVGAGRFELPTSRSRSARAAELRYAPNERIIPESVCLTRVCVQRVLGGELVIRARMLEMKPDQGLNGHDGPVAISWNDGCIERLRPPV